MKIQAELNIINRKLVLINAIGAPGGLLLALSLYTLFTSNDDVLFSVLKNTTVVYGMLIIGTIIEAWVTIKNISLYKRRSVLLKERNI